MINAFGVEHTSISKDNGNAYTVGAVGATGAGAGAALKSRSYRKSAGKLRASAAQSQGAADRFSGSAKKHLAAAGRTIQSGKGQSLFAESERAAGTKHRATAALHAKDATEFSGDAAKFGQDAAKFTRKGRIGLASSAVLGTAGGAAAFKRSRLNKADGERRRTALAVGSGAAGLGALQMGAAGGAAHLGHRALKPYVKEGFQESGRLTGQAHKAKAQGKIFEANDLSHGAAQNREMAGYGRSAVKGMNITRKVGLGGAAALGAGAVGADLTRRHLKLKKGKSDLKKADDRKNAYVAASGAAGTGAGVLGYHSAKHTNAASKKRAAAMQMAKEIRADIRGGFHRGGKYGAGAAGLAGVAGLAAYKSKRKQPALQLAVPVPVTKAWNKHDTVAAGAGTAAGGAGVLAASKYAQSKKPYGPEIKTLAREAVGHEKAAQKHLKMPKPDSRPGAVNKPLSEGQLKGKLTNFAHRHAQAAEVRGKYRALGEAHKAGNLKALRIGHSASAAGVGLAGLAGAAHLTRNRKRS